MVRRYLKWLILLFLHLLKYCVRLCVSNQDNRTWVSMSLWNCFFIIQHIQLIFYTSVCSAGRTHRNLAAFTFVIKYRKNTLYILTGWHQNVCTDVKCFYAFVRWLVLNNNMHLFSSRMSFRLCFCSISVYYFELLSSGSIMTCKELKPVLLAEKKWGPGNVLQIK